MTDSEAIKIFNDLLDVPCEMLIKYDSVINSEKKQALVRLRTAEEFAIKALEKQIPKKIAKYDVCPVCNNNQSTTWYYVGSSYCEICGQKLDWNE